ncbi:MAG: hypothetical protein U0841_12790 [Chloroflexia bacterium]
MRRERHPSTTPSLPTPSRPHIARRCATVPLPWGFLPLCAIVLLAGDAFCRSFLPVAPVGSTYPAPGPGNAFSCASWRAG